ncbi:hypothetical protein VTL71DRAFT_12270 [Oculimacula yallundae]|uniref:2EXR domain-containing protein n=1 Tax=Oculimacula yallundae TaxID=86028 RepID=A0ABR4CMI7_9HELO
MLTQQTSIASTSSSQSEPSQTINQPDRTFTKFLELPTEIQLQIWKEAVPDPRSILGVIHIILDFDLGKPRAILPSVRDYKHAYRIKFHFDDTTEDDSDPQYAYRHAEYLYSNTAMTTSRAPVFALLGTCQMARSETLKSYRLAIGSGILEENEPWWSPEEDMVIFTGTELEISLLPHLLFFRRAEPPPVFDSLQHVAIPAIRGLAKHLLTDFPSSRVWNMEDGWSFNFPALRSFTMLVDPASILNRKTGKVLLHEPEDKAVDVLMSYRSQDFIGHLTAFFAEDLDDGEEAPLVEVYVAGWKGKRSRRH